MQHYAALAAAGWCCQGDLKNLEGIAMSGMGMGHSSFGSCDLVTHACGTFSCLGLCTALVEGVSCM